MRLSTMLARPETAANASSMSLHARGRRGRIFFDFADGSVTTGADAYMLINACRALHLLTGDDLLVREQPPRLMAARIKRCAARR